MCEVGIHGGTAEMGQMGGDYEDHALKVMLDNIPNMLAMEAPRRLVCIGVVIGLGLYADRLLF